MKKIYILTIIAFSLTCLIGCNNKALSESIEKIKLTGDLVTYQAYYHNVLEYDKEAGDGLFNLFEKDRRLFAEYTGTIKYGIDLSKVKIGVKGSTINVVIPKAKVIGEANIDSEDFKPENFIESKDGWINPNPITADDISIAFNQAQEEMKSAAEKDEKTLSMAQKRARIVIEENIKQFIDLSENDYKIEWKYE